MFPGAIYGKGYAELQSHCLAYIHATEVGGTHPALIEAMGRGCVALYLDTPENREAAGASGIAYAKSAEELAERIEWVSAAAPGELRRLQEDAVTDAACPLRLGARDRSLRAVVPRDARGQRGLTVVKPGRRYTQIE